MIDPTVLFKNDWYDILLPYTISPEFQNHMEWLKSEYNSGICYPPSTKIFRAFNSCQPQMLRVVWLGLDPYINEGEATGLAMAVEGSKYPPTLRNLEKEFNSDLGRDGLDFSFSKYADRVLFLNTALTVRQKETKSHWEQWQPFTTFVLDTINSKMFNILFVLLGKEAQKYAENINIRDHAILMAPHPVSETYKPGSGFFGSKIFSKINQHVNDYFGEDNIF